MQRTHSLGNAASLVSPQPSLPSLPCSFVLQPWLSAFLQPTIITFILLILTICIENQLHLYPEEVFILALTMTSLLVLATQHILNIYWKFLHYKVMKKRSVEVPQSPCEKVHCSLGCGSHRAGFKLYPSCDHIYCLFQSPCSHVKIHCTAILTLYDYRKWNDECTVSGPRTPHNHCCCCHS